MTRIIVGVDGSGASRAALRWAVAGAGPDDRVEAVWVVENGSDGRGRDDPTDPARVLDEAVDEALAEVSEPVPVRARVLRGPVAARLVSRAGRGGHVVLGRTATPDAVPGSVVSACLREAAGPVTVVPGP